MKQNTLTQTAEYVKLAETCYTNFSNINSSTDVINDMINKENGKLPQSFANSIVKEWNIIAHYQDRGTINPLNKESGFSATLFQNKETQEYVLATRGTAGGKDIFVTDIGDIVHDGLAHHQIVDLYNFWQQLTHTGTYQAAKIIEPIELIAEWKKSGKKLEDFVKDCSESGIFIDSGTIKQIIFQDSDIVFNDERAKGLGVISEDQKITVTGHSLGGHLSSAFSRLFPENTEQSYMFNGAGYGAKLNLLGHLAGQWNINAVFETLGGADNFDYSKIINIIGDKGMDFIAQDWFVGLEQPGQATELFIENWNASNLFGHGSKQMTDTMSVMSLFGQIDENINNDTTQNALAKINPIFDNIAKDDSQTLEKVLFNLEKLLSGKNNNSVKQITTDDRNAIYQKITELGDIIEEQKIKGELIYLTDKNSAEIKQMALTDDDNGLACRYALKLLTPFTFTGDMASNHNSNGELDLYSPDNKNGMTEEYIKDRFAMLKELYSSYSEQIYDDMTTGIHLEMPEDLANGEYYSDHPEYTQRKIVFGTDGDDKEIAGGAYMDKLYGGAGDDVLIAGEATTYTDSGDGYDIPETHDDGVEDYLEGGVGFDTYYVGNKDKIFDADGKGKIILNGHEIQGKFESPDENNATVWYQTDENGNKTGISAHKINENNLMIKNNGNNITIKNFFQVAKQLSDDSFLGLNIHLSNQDTHPETPDTSDYLLWTGDIRPNTKIIYEEDGSMTDTGIYDVNWKDHSQRNENGEIINGEFQAGFADVIIGQAGKNNKIYGLDGNDALSGGNRDDLIDGGDGDDLISGHTGSDIFYGGAGDDRIFTNMIVKPNARYSDNDQYSFGNAQSIIIKAPTWVVIAHQDGRREVLK